MSEDGWNLEIASAAVDQASRALLVEEAASLAFGMLLTRYLAIAALTFLVYDMWVTLGMEIQYVWSAPWNFGRFAFHFNRALAPCLQILQIISLFQYRPSTRFCVIAGSVYVWGTMAIVVGVMTVLIARVWLLYFRKPWVLVVLLVSAVIVSVPPVLMILVVFRQDGHISSNPAPDVIPGCLFTGISKWTWIPYVGSTLYESLLFGLTVYKVYNAEYELPIINRLYRDGTCYYVVVLAANIFTMVGSQIPIISGCATGSGLLGSIMSAMCSRMLLSTKSFEANRDETISQTIRVPRRLAGSDFWGIVEVDRTSLYIKSLPVDSESGVRGGSGGWDTIGPLPVMYVPGGPGLRSGWVRRDSEGEIVVARSS